MPTIDVALRPEELTPDHLAGRTAVVFDVLRATTTMAAALAAGVAEIRVFPSTDAAREAAGRFDGARILCGEVRCLPPPGFDLGNSPGAFDPDKHRGRTAFMSTTNGTKAILAAAAAADRFVAALVNATAAARAAAATGRDVTLVCAGTDAAVAMEDVIGAGAVATALAQTFGYGIVGDVARIAVRLFAATRNDLRAALADAQGGRNVLTAGLPDDVAFAARLDGLHAIGRVVTRGGDVTAVVPAA